jgi:uncharacterized protein YbaP (TraB family)
MAKQSTMLWRSDDLPQVLILGSIHFLDGTLPDWVWEVHQGADAVVFEADFREAPPPPTMPQGLAMPSLDPELWQMVEDTARDLGLDAEVMRDLSVQYPFQIGQRLAISTLERAGARFEQGAEGVLLERTAIPLFLESCQEFYQTLYQDTPLSEHVACLRLTMSRLSQLPERFRRAAESWRMGKPEAVLDALGFSEYFSDFPGLASGLFANRHSVWLPRAEYYIKKAAEFGHRLLIVVGCSHLVGPQTLLADLEEHYNYKFRQTS